MPVLTAAACTPTVDCPIIAFPQAEEGCECTLSVGGINALYFFPCTAVLSEENLLDPEWWQGFVDGSGVNGVATISGGLGSLAKKTDKKERVTSCRVEQLISTTWAITYVIKCFDKTSARTTNAQVNALITRSNNYLLVARMCDGTDTVLPVGGFTTSDFNYTVPDNFEEFQSMSVELGWVELGLPVTYDVPGLSAVIPKSL